MPFSLENMKMTFTQASEKILNCLDFSIKKWPRKQKKVEEKSRIRKGRGRENIKSNQVLKN
jgi:hypothetical protein